MQRRRLSSETSSNREIKRLTKRRSISGIRHNIYGEQNVSNKIYVSRTDLLKYRVNTPTPADDRGLHPEFFRLLIRHTWQLYSLSPLSNLSFREVKLKHYATRIKQALARKIQDTTNNISFKATVAVISETNENESEVKSLQIEVTQQKGNSEPQPKYRGILLHWEDDLESEYNLKHLPLLLCTGTINIMRIVHNTMQEIFDTVVRPFTISQEDIIWLSLLSAFSYKSRGNKKFVQYGFTIPYQSTKNLIKISLPAASLKICWNKIHPQESEEILYEEKDRFYKILHEELTLCFNIKFEKLQLHHIVAPDVSVHSTGRVKFHDEEGAVKVLDFLQSIASLLDDPCPPMGFRFEQ